MTDRSSYALEDPEDDGLCGRLDSTDEQLGHRLGDSRMGFLAEGVIWCMQPLDAHLGG
jgi:hypothetical protein